MGEPLAETQTGAVDRMTQNVQRKYRDEGYSFARAQASFDPASGVRDDRRQRRDDRRRRVPGRRREARAAVRRRVRAARRRRVQPRARAAGARRAAAADARRGPSRPLYGDRSTFTPARDMRRRRGIVRSRRSRRPAHAARRPARAARAASRSFPTSASARTGSPPSTASCRRSALGAAVFDHDRFNHTYVAGHLSYKVASEHAGYALGFERPFFDGTEALSRRRAARPDGQRRPLAALLDRSEPGGGWAAPQLPRLLPPPRRADQRRRCACTRRSSACSPGAASARSRWSTRATSASGTTTSRSGRTSSRRRPAERGRASARRSTAAASTANRSRRPTGGISSRRRSASGSSDLGSAGAIGRRSGASTGRRRSRRPGRSSSDFDFRRHIVSGRARLALSPHQDFGVRAIGGWSDGVLAAAAPVRRSAASGRCIGYDFKEEVGDSMALVNLEYALGWRNGLKLFGFFDVGRASVDRARRRQRAVAERRWLGHRRRRRPRRLRLQGRRHSRLASGAGPASAGRSDSRISMRTVRAFVVCLPAAPRARWRSTSR